MWKLGDILIPVKINVDDIVIKNIESHELKDVLKCINQSSDNFKLLGRDTAFTCEDLRQRYLETLISSLEFFCGIYINNQVIGIIKGRIENKSSSELWILSMLLLEEYRGNGIGTRALKAFENYFHQNFSIEKYCVLIMEGNIRGQRFWNRNSYKLARITKSVIGFSEKDMIILEKKLNK
jgi:GNAT superfamily N-acetyltransferase